MSEQEKKKSFADILSFRKTPDQKAINAVVGSVNLRKDTRHMEVLTPETPVEGKKEAEKTVAQPEPAVKPELKAPPVENEGSAAPPAQEHRPASRPSAERRPEKDEEEKEKKVFSLVDIGFKYSLDVDNTIEELLSKMRRENPEKKRGFYTKKKLFMMGIREMFRKNGMDVAKIDEFIKEGLR